MMCVKGPGKERFMLVLPHRDQRVLLLPVSERLDPEQVADQAPGVGWLLEGLQAGD